MKLRFNFGYIVGQNCFLNDEKIQRALNSRKSLPVYAANDKYAEMVNYCTDNKNFPSLLGITEIKRVG